MSAADSTTAGSPLVAAWAAGSGGGRVVRAAIWLPGLAVAVGAAVATAHGLYEVAAAANVPEPIAWLYPLITDGLALVAYAATARLSGPGARYAWSVVVLAAGLSGLAQAAFLAAGSSVEASAALRFGVGAWPAVAAAIVAHLLYLLATDTTAPSGPAERERSVPATVDEPGPAPAIAVQPAPFTPAAVQPAPAVQPVATAAVQPDPPRGVQPPVAVPAAPVRPALAPAPTEQPDRRSGGTPARDRARAAATRHAARHGSLPTVSELEITAEVSRGTAAAALKALRDHPAPLHLITTSTASPEQDDDPTIEERTQP